MPEVGELKHTIIFRQSTTTRSTSGGELENWTSATAVATCRAKIEPLRGEEQLQSGIQNAVAEYRIWIWYRPGISTKHRIYYGSQVLEIVSLKNFREESEWLEIMAKEWRDG